MTSKNNHLGEQLLKKFFKEQNIFYKYEQPMLILDKNKYLRIWYPDFYLPEYGIIVEYFGMRSKKDYDEGTKNKKIAYASMKLQLIPVYKETLNKNWEPYILKTIQNILQERLNTFNNRQIV